MAEPKACPPPVAATEVIEESYVTVRDEEFNQLLEEWSEIVYCYLCQLSEKKILVPETSQPFAGGKTGIDEK